jgi:predicted nucleotidyltransferase
MDRIVTLKERKATEADRRRRAVEDMRSALAAYAREHGGRFLLFGSAARGDMRSHSDVDIQTDFSEPETSAAWNFAERACWDRKLDPDIMPRSWCKAEFIAHIQPDIEVIG